jgi:hypothetical protein
MLLSEVIQLAGGPAGNANLEDMRIQRIDEELWNGDELRVVLAQGRTLDQMNLRGGDALIVPLSTESVWGSVLRWGLGVAGSAVLGYGLFR